MGVNLNKERNITIKDVANEAGVSIGTVSNVLNGLETVKEENRSKVLKTIKELGYIPNLTAQSLKTHKTKTIGLILPSIFNPFYPALARGVEDLAHNMGYTLILCNTDRDVNREKEYLDMLISKGVDGIVLVKPIISVDKILNYSKGFNLILIDDIAGGNTELDVIEVSNYEGSVKAASYLIALKHKKIAYISGTLNSKSSVERLKGFKDTLKDKYINVDESLIKIGDFTWQSGYKLAKELLVGDNKPTAIYCGNDLMAVGAMKAIKEMGFEVPKDISVVGFDDIDVAELTTPTLTTIRQPKYEQGEKAARVLFDRIQGVNKGSFRTYVLSTELVVRESTGICYK